MKLILLLVFLSFYSCVTRNDKSYEDEINNLKKDFSREPFKTFISLDSIALPRNKNLDIIYPKAIVYYNFCGIQLLCEYDSFSFKKMTTLIKKKTSRKIIFSDTTKYHIIDWKHKYDYKNFSARLPFPELDDDFSNFKQKIDLENSKIHFISYEEGIYVKPEFIASDKKIEKYFQKGFHGYSNGAIVDSLNQRILYWITIF